MKRNDPSPPAPNAGPSTTLTCACSVASAPGRIGQTHRGAAEHLRPDRFRALDADVAVRVWAAAAPEVDA